MATGPTLAVIGGGKENIPPPHDLEGLLEKVFRQRDARLVNLYERDHADAVSWCSHYLDSVFGGVLTSPSSGGSSKDHPNSESGVSSLVPHSTGWHIRARCFEVPNPLRRVAAAASPRSKERAVRFFMERVLFLYV